MLGNPYVPLTSLVGGLFHHIPCMDGLPVAPVALWRVLVLISAGGTVSVGQLSLNVFASPWARHGAGELLLGPWLLS